MFSLASKVQAEVAEREEEDAKKKKKKRRRRSNWKEQRLAQADSVEKVSRVVPRSELLNMTPVEYEKHVMGK